LIERARPHHEEFSVRILIADDHEIVRRLLRLMLEARPNVEVTEAADGEEAVRKAAATAPDVIILDVNMPVLTGVSAAKEIREILPHVPILLLSMYDQEQLEDELRLVDVQGFIQKIDVMSKLPQALDSLEPSRLP
jgi:DNA-binding NarL/FixJ family response regulator